MCTTPFFSPHVITALTDVITGGAGRGQVETPYGTYRTGSQIEGFFGACNAHLSIGPFSRVPTVRQRLIELNRNRDFDSLKRLIEASVEPSSYGNRTADLQEAVEYLNAALRSNRYELREHDGRFRLESTGTTTAATAALEDLASGLDYDSVQRDLTRALEQADGDPEDAITAACSIVESVCRCILEDMDRPLPARMVISQLVREVQRSLDLSPERTDIEPDVRHILGGLSTVAAGIGALRTHAGDAHGRARGTGSVDARLAHLAIHAASAISLFFIETWQARTPPNSSTAPHDDRSAAS